MNRFRVSLAPDRLVSMVVLVVVLFAGCGPSGEPESTGDPPAPPAATRLDDADAVLNRMVQIYQSAKHYRDRGRLRLAYRVDGVMQEDVAPLSVQFSRAEGRLRVEAYQTTIVCDGEHLRALIKDDSTNNLDQQFVQRPLPEPPLTLQWIYEDRVMAELINRGLGRQPITLELLLAEKPLEGFRGEQAERSLLKSRKLDGRSCYRLRLATEEGEFVLWIDEDSFALQRMEYPTREVAADVKQRFGAEEVELAADFFSAAFEPPAESRYRLDEPDGAKRVQQFITPPQPLPSQLFGQRVSGFSFRDPNTGATVDAESLRGGDTVLLWVSDHPAGEATARQLETVRAAAEGETQFLLVVTEPKEVSDPQVLDLVDRWGWRGRVVRDAAAVGRDVFRIDLLPTLVVLNQNGVVQVFDEGQNPTLPQDLANVLAMLQRGEDVAASVVQQAQNERLRYEAALIREGVQPQLARGGGEKLATPKATQPFEIPWNVVWTNRELTAPGNILARSGVHSIWVNEGWRSVAVLNPRDGTLQKTAPLDLPENASVSMLTTPHGKLQGQVFAGGDLLGKQVFVFDDQWERLISYPDAAVKHAGIRDWQVEDLNDDGQWQLAVGFWELLGVHGVEQDGRRKWGNRECGSVQSVVSGAPSPIGWRQWMIVGDTGRVHPLNHHGNAEPIMRGPELIDQLYSAPGTAGHASPYLAISTSSSGRRTVRGMTDRLNEVWAYDNFPAAAHRNRLRFVTSGRIRLGDAWRPLWILAGPDGSVHLIGHEGVFNDFFYFGKPIDGIAAWDDGERSLLLIAADGEVRAIELAAPTQ